MHTAGQLVNRILSHSAYLLREKSPWDFLYSHMLRSHISVSFYAVSIWHLRVLKTYAIREAEENGGAGTIKRVPHTTSLLCDVNG